MRPRATPRVGDAVELCLGIVALACLFVWLALLPAVGFLYVVGWL